MAFQGSFQLRVLWRSKGRQGKVRSGRFPSTSAKFNLSVQPSTCRRPATPINAAHWANKDPARNAFAVVRLAAARGAYGGQTDSAMPPLKWTSLQTPFDRQRVGRLRPQPHDVRDSPSPRARFAIRADHGRNPMSLRLALSGDTRDTGSDFSRGPKRGRRPDRQGALGGGGWN